MALPPKFAGQRLSLSAAPAPTLHTLELYLDYVYHHDAHAANAFFLSPFDSAAVLTVDGRGEAFAVPICYAFDGVRFFTPIDEKPKRTDRLLKRVRNIQETGRATLLIGGGLVWCRVCVGGRRSWVLWRWLSLGGCLRPACRGWMVGARGSSWGAT
jgi:hypothetical protein